MLEKKGIEKYRFSGPKGLTGRGYGQPAQPVEGYQKLSLFSSDLLFPVEATVTCHALNAPTASEPIDP